MKETTAKVVEIDGNLVIFSVGELQAAVNVGSLADKGSILQGAKKGDQFSIEYNGVPDGELDAGIIIDRIVRKIT